MFDYVFEQFSPVGVLHDQVDALGTLDDLVELDHVLLSDGLENADLPPDSFPIGRVHYFFLLEHLDGHLDNIYALYSPSRRS